MMVYSTLLFFLFSLQTLVLHHLKIHFHNLEMVFLMVLQLSPSVLLLNLFHEILLLLYHMHLQNQLQDPLLI